MHFRVGSVLIAAALLAACSTAPKRPDWPVIDNSFIRGDKASPSAPRIGVPFNNAPRFLRLGISSYNTDRDVQPISRMPARYPEECMATAAQRETVLIEFDVTPEGTVVNRRVIDSSNPCFDKTGIKAVERWRYQPKLVEGKPRWRLGVQTVMSFELAEESEPYVPPSISGERKSAPVCRPQKRPEFSRCRATGTRTSPAIIKFDVSPDGYVIAPQIEKSSGDRCFDYYAKVWIYSSICDPPLDGTGYPRWYRGNRARVTPELGN